MMLGIDVVDEEWYEEYLPLSKSSVSFRSWKQKKSLTSAPGGNDRVRCHS